MDPKSQTTSNKRGQREATEKSLRLVMLVGDKGGTGKTTFARLLAEEYRTRNQDALLVDGDGTVGQLIQYLGERDDDRRLIPEQTDAGVRYFTLHGSERDRDQILTHLESQRAIVLMDLPAASLNALRLIEQDVGFLKLVESSGYGLTLISVITPYRASVAGVANALSLAPSARHVVVQNLAFGDEDDFTIWETSKTRASLVEHGGVVLKLPALKARIAAVLDASSIRFHAAAASPALSLPDRARAQRWLNDAVNALSPATEALGLA